MRKTLFSGTLNSLEIYSETRLTELKGIMSYRAFSVKTRPCVFVRLYPSDMFIGIPRIYFSFF
jgi:hypothetical protein